MASSSGVGSMPNRVRALVPSTMNLRELVAHLVDLADGGIQQAGQAEQGPGGATLSVSRGAERLGDHADDVAGVMARMLVTPKRWALRPPNSTAQTSATSAANANGTWPRAHVYEKASGT